MLLISITDELSNAHVKRIKTLVEPMEVTVVRDLLEKPYILDQVKILITYGDQVGKEILNLMPVLQWIQVFQSGVELIPSKLLQERNIMLTNIRDFHGIPMTEYVMSIVLAVTRDHQKYAQYQQQKRWYREEYVEEAYGKTISIFGSGAIGQQIAEKCHMFGMKVLGVNTSGISKPYFDEMFTLQEKMKVIKRSDFIVLLLPSVPETYHCFAEQEFSAMKKSAYFINIGRGSLVCTEDLIKSLNKNKIKGAAIDVVEGEPILPEHDIWNARGLTITPHIAARSNRYFDRAIEKFALNLHAFLSEETPPYYVDLIKGY